MRLHKPVLECPNCKSPTLEKRVYTPTEEFSSFSMRKTLRQYQLNCIVEYHCTTCHFTCK